MHIKINNVIQIIKNTIIQQQNKIKIIKNKNFKNSKITLII